MKAAQGGKCAICQKESDDLCVEHCHKTSRIRSLSCRKCNSALGMFCEDPAVLQRAIEYLKKHWNAYYEDVERRDKCLEDELY